MFLGIAINKDGVVYFADGANIRTIDNAGIIRTVIGSQGHLKYFQPLPCYKVTTAADVCLSSCYNCYTLEVEGCQ